MQPDHLSLNGSRGRSRLIPPALIAFLALAAFAAFVPSLLAPPRPSAVPSPSSISASAADSSPDPSAASFAANAALSIPDSTPQSGPGIDAARKQIDKLVDEQKFAEAAAEAARIRASAVRASNDALWAWALIREVQLRTALHGYETSVRFLKEEPWPAAPLQRDMLELFYAQSLVTYYRAYSWEINGRERVEAGPSASLSASLATAAPSGSPSAAAASPSGPVDLKLWTRDQILAEAWSALLRVWRDRDRLAASRAGQFPDFWSPGDYPPGIRDTLRDAVVYVMASLLSDTSFWTPRQSNDLFLLDLPALLSDAPVPPSSAASTLESSAAHPLEKLHALLGEHAGWSLGASRPEAAMEAYFVLVSSLHDAFTQPDDRAAIRARLTAYLDLASHRRHAWWAMGRAALAEFTSAEDAPDALIRARALALAGAERYPGSPGGLRCLHIAKSIEAPSFSAEMMATDAPDRRSIRLMHRNVRTIYFRAYALDLRAAIRDARDYNLFPRWDEAEKIVDGRAAPAPPLAASFTALLPATPDYRDHATYVDLPPGLLPGLYLVAASAREDFARSANRIEALCAIVSGLVVLNRPSPDGGTEAVVVSGADGRPSRGVKVDLYAYDWQNGHHIVESRLTDDDGRAAFPPPDRDRNRRSGPFFLLASRGSDLALDASHRYLYARPVPAETSASLIYTDRSVYRPGQKIYWKVLAYAGRRDLGRLRPAAESTVSVWLEDINGERVAAAAASTNGFGTAAGEFVIPPAGRPLGAWRLRSSPNGLAQVRVEEYKRPTFEVKVEDPAQALRLNRPATLSAQARYYFGLPVASGTAVWQVRREPVYPRWWWYRGGSGGPGSASQIVAGGRAALRDDGTFEIAFTPSVDERTAATSPGVTYRYTLSVDVTDEGGETRSAGRSFRLGFVSVEASISAGDGYFRAGAPAAFTVSRSDLNGTPKPGRGAWHVVRLVQPESTLLPADQPMPGRPGTPFAETAGAKGPGGASPDAFERYGTPGDRLRPRWEQAPPPEAILRLWQDGRRVASGSVESDASGRAAIAVPALDDGAYRLIYQTGDDFGATCRESFDFLVAGKTTLAANLPLVLVAERPTVEVGGKARLLLHGGWAGQPMLLETFRGGEVWERRWIQAGAAGAAGRSGSRGGAADGSSTTAGPVIEIPVTEDLRGGFGARLTALRDHQFMTEEASVFVPWTNKQLALSFATFRDKLTPGGRETWRVTVKTPSGKPAEQGAAELLAYMYDRSLDLFAPHHPPNVLGLYPARTGAAGWATTLGTAVQSFQRDYGWASVPSYPTFRAAHLIQLGSYGIGGPGRRGRFLGGVVGGVVSEAAPSAVMKQGRLEEGEAKYAADAVRSKEMPAPGEEKPAAGAAESGVEMRSNFAETAFWQPRLLTGADGTAAIEFTVPDSVTSWRVFVHGVTRDLAGGMLQAEARSVKELMVRPYLPRFFREGDRAELRVVVNNAGEAAMAGQVELEITDPATGENLAAAFGLEAAGADVEARGAGAVKAGGEPGAAQAAASAGTARASFKVEPGKGATVAFALAAPPRVGTVAFKVTARAGAWSDGELRPLPVLPGRMHLVQSRFVTLKGGGPGAVRELRFADLAKNDDPTRVNDQMVITVDGQLFYGLLEALPYLVNYPYECTEQTLNRFLSTGILTSLYDRYPAVARMAEALSRRETLWETFDQTDPNRKMALEETPWLVQSRGGNDAGHGMEKVLDPRVAGAQREASLAKLLKAQTSLGAFPWWPGGPPSPYMTLYIVHGFSKALEFGVSVPKEPVVKAMEYLHRHYLDEVVRRLMAMDAGWEFVTFLNYTLSNFPDESWRGGMFTDEERAAMLAFSFKHWKRHSPYLKGFLALTLKREKRAKDAQLVWASVMDSARTTEDEGTSWAPEDRGWLWYNDTIETHAFALRTLMELDPKDRRSEGLVQWLFLNKKLNHWKSTRATAEVIYSVAYFLKTTGALGVRESVTVDACGGAVRTVFTFEPDVYTGKKNQLVIPGGKLGGGDAAGAGDAADASGAPGGGGRGAAGGDEPCAVVKVTKEGKGMAFASATWHFSTERMPEKGEGDLFAIERTWFKREKRGPGAGQAGGDGETVLLPLTDGVELAVGDEIEVHLSIRARHPAEYVMLRDPRPSGCEPVTLTSGYKWDLGLVRYEEIRDSGTNFFMENLPQGEYTLKHRMRCAMAGTFKAAPATLQSMYAPEFAAYSSGETIGVTR